MFDELAKYRADSGDEFSFSPPVIGDATATFG
jgi:hypothetical protein